ncbi:MAG: type II toxin-antitoxin system RelE/ParE family toxin [Campylobacterales bacterium]
MTYEIEFHEEALEEFLSLDGSVRKLVAKQIKKISASPQLGEELGNKNGIDLTGCRKMYVDQKRVRIVYEIIERKVVVHIVAIGKREEMQVYKDALKRLDRF